MRDRQFKVAMCACLISVAVWGMWVWSHMPDSGDIAAFGQFGDSMAPAGLLLAGAGLFLNALATMRQRSEVQAQLEEMKETTRFQARQEAQNNIENLIERLNGHRRAVSKLAALYMVRDWTADQGNSWREGLVSRNHPDPDFEPHLRTWKLYKDAVLVGGNYQTELSKAETELFGNSASKESQESRQRREHLLAEVSKWHSEQRFTYFRMKDLRAFDDAGEPPIREPQLQD